MGHFARDPFLPDGPRCRLLWSSDFRRRAVRLPRRRPLLLPAPPARSVRVGRWPLAPLGARGERRHAPPGQPNGRCSLPGEGGLRAVPVSARGPGLSHRPYPAGVRGDARPRSALAGELGRGDAGRDGVRLRRAGAVPVLQRHLPCGGGLVATGSARGRSLAETRAADRPGRAGSRAGDGEPRRRPGIGLPDGGLRRGVCRRARGERAEVQAERSARLP